MTMYKEKEQEDLVQQINSYGQTKYIKKVQ